MNILLKIGNIHNRQGCEDDARSCRLEAYEVFYELGLSENRPELTMLMESLIKVEIPVEIPLKVEAETEEVEEHKKAEASGTIFRKMTKKIKGILPGKN